MDRRTLRPSGPLDFDRHFLQVLSDPWYRTLVSLQDAISVATVQFWSSRGLKQLHLPLTTGSISSPMGLGSDSLPVKVSLFEIDTYLADSMQFALEFGTRLSPNGCYYLMPSFRGEAVDATHLAQFFHSEAEIPGTLDDVITIVESYIRYLCETLLDKATSEIASVTGDLSHIESVANDDAPFHRLTFDEAAKMLNHNPDYIVTADAGWRNLTRKGEQKLISQFPKGFVWVTHWDHMSVPFYQAFSETDGRYANNADLLFGIGEVVGSGQRHRTRNDVERSLRLHGVDTLGYEWYCTLKEEYPLQTAGFGMGIERFILWVLKHNDIRHLQLLPRVNGLNIIP